MREKGQTEVAKTLETPVFSRGIEILTEKFGFTEVLHDLYGFLTETCFNGIVGKQKEEVM